MHIKSAERAIDRFLVAVDECDHIDLSIRLLPKTDMDMKRIAHEWNSQSSASHAFFGVLSAIDGWLCTTEKPSDVSNPSDYFSGHYQRFGYNVQASCNANLRFIYFTVAGPGKTNDARVFRKLTLLRQWLDSLKNTGYFIVGDNAYQLSNTLLIPFSGVDANDVDNDVYNFYLSQLRIRIEMSFGRLVSKWRIFRSDLYSNNGSAKNIRIMRVGAKLHNFVINADQLNFLNVDDNDFDTIQVTPLEDGPEGNRGYLPMPIDEEPELDCFNLRNTIVETLKEMGLERPDHNIKRNNNN